MILSIRDEFTERTLPIFCRSESILNLSTVVFTIARSRLNEP